MHSVEELRKRHGWNVTQLGHATGQDRRLLADLERGAALASSEVANLLSKHGILGLACTGDLIQKKELRCLRLEPYAVPHHNREAWERAAGAWPTLYEKLSRRDWNWLVRHVRADSALECDLWVRLVLAGAKLRLANPHSCGFRSLPVVDEQGNALGERVLPCLHVRWKEIEFLVWPQVSMRPNKWTFRVDGLVLRLSPRPHWGVLEADGEGHDHEKDSFRAAQLLQDTVRLSKADIHSPKLIELLTERLLAI